VHDGIKAFAWLKRTRRESDTPEVLGACRAGFARALGVEQASDAEVCSSEELLHDRDQRRWELERDVAEESR
jgi:hypothetical protein